MKKSLTVEVGLFALGLRLFLLQPIPQKLGYEDDNQGGDDAEDDDPFAPILVRYPRTVGLISDPTELDAGGNGENAHGADDEIADARND